MEIQNDNLDVIILAYALKNKKFTMELVNSITEEYFLNDNRWIFNKIKSYFTNPRFKNIPSKNMIFEGMDVKNTNTQKYYRIYDEIVTQSSNIDDNEFEWYLDKIKNRHNINLHKKCIDSLSNANNLQKANEIIKEITVEIDSIYKKQVYKEGSLRESAKERLGKYLQVEENPEEAKGILTGFKELDRITNGLHPGELMIIAGDTGCQPAGSKVLMADGQWKKIEDIVIGDKIMSPQYDGTVIPNVVINTMVFHNRDIYKVISNGRRQPISYRASHNHILPIVEVYGKTNKSRVINISIDDYNKKSRNWKAQTKIFTAPAYDLSKKYFRVHPYVVGVMLGDGSLINHPNITSADPEIFDGLEKLGVTLGKEQDKHNSKAKTRNITGEYVNKIREVLGRHNGHHKFVPREYFLGSVEQRLELLAGLIDTDGTAEEFCSSSRQLAEDFRELVYSVGGIATLKERTTSYNKGETKFISYRVHYSFAEHRPNVRLARKQQKQRNMKWKNPRNINFNVIYDGKDSVYGFTLDGQTQWYVTDDYIVTHNTGKSIVMHNIGVNAYLNKNTPYSPKECITDSGKNILYFSLEMPKESIERRIDSCMGNLYYNQIRDGLLSPEDKERYRHVLKFQANYNKNFYIVDVPKGATTREIELKYIEICESKFKPDLILVDYLGIMNTNDNIRGDSSDWLSLGQISAELHEFARVYSVPVVTGSQVNRPKEMSKQEYSTNRIARSGMIPTNANVIIQIGCREDEYMRTDMPIYITKMRDGEKSSFTLNKDFARMRVFDISADSFSSEEEIDDSI